MSIAPAKVNLGLVVGPPREDGKHEVLTVVERLDLADTVVVERLADGAEHLVTGFAGDTIARAALDALRAASSGAAAFAVHIEKRIPVAAGLGGGSSDAAAALQQANRLLDDPLPHDALLAVAARLGADVPLFLQRAPSLATGDGTNVVPIDLPRGYHVVVWLPPGAVKASTAAVYAAFDRRRGDEGWEERRAALLTAIERVREPEDIALLPRNDLASSPLAGELEALGAFRADVTGAGPALYGLFRKADDARHAATVLAGRGTSWVATPYDPRP